MILLFVFLLILQLYPAVPPILAEEKSDTTECSPVPEGKARKQIMSEDDYVKHFVALYLLLEEYGEDWNLFKKKREEYFLTNGITGNDLLSFLTGREEEPEYWFKLWEKIYDALPESEKKPPSVPK